MVFSKTETLQRVGLPSKADESAASRQNNCYTKLDRARSL